MKTYRFTLTREEKDALYLAIFEQSAREDFPVEVYDPALEDELMGSTNAVDLTAEQLRAALIGLRALSTGTPLAEEYSTVRKTLIQKSRYEHRLIC